MTDETGRKLEVNIDDNVRDKAICMYVEQSMYKESIATFHDYIADGCTPTDALAHAVINEMVIDALQDELTRENFTQAVKKEE